ncbi:MAG: exodeoxyribonuclease VII large subunit [Clostridia bacterium]|nr:exodeoxyribonuclease VII large subunit [Clostridia bacterium]
MEKSVITVRQLNLYVRSLLEGDSRLLNIAVTGEISNLKNHYSSGHLYFTLKDNDASIRCVMFRTFASRIKFKPEDGIQVVLRGRVSVYEKDGQYQFYAEEMSPLGIGDVALQFEQIKARLEAEGLFDPESKRPIPKFPKNIAVITSQTGAAIQDILNILGRRWPLTQIIICPVSVQGELAVPEMLEALERVYNLGLADLIIIGRGGGSVEDLWAFNSETLARKIFESPIPVISAVGHETDFTICDFVADLRAPTPSAAAELAVPDCAEINLKLERFERGLKNSLTAKYELCLSRLEKCLESIYFKKPMDAFVNNNFMQLDHLYEKLCDCGNQQFKRYEDSLASLALRLDGLSPLKVLSRGYAALQKDGEAVYSINDIKPCDIIDLRLRDGSAKCEILEITKEKNDG